MADAVTSYTSADSIPYKLLQDHKTIASIVRTKSIPPRHVQFIPTNKCNLNCSFCSCSNENRSQEMPLRDMVRAVDLLAAHGTVGMTITGGGEPMMYPHLQNLLEFAYWKEIKTGLVTNGLLLHPNKAFSLNTLSWCRISYGDDRDEFSKEHVADLLQLVALTRHIGWAISYVVSKNPNMERIKQAIALAAALKATHIRFVADLLCADQVPMQEVEKELESYLELCTVPVIFQARSKPEKEQDCYICYLKPVVAPDLKVYACCGVQYALPTPTRNLPKQLCLGSIWNFASSRRNKPFPGAKACVTCYYGAYNRMLKGLLTEIDHKEFV